MYYVYILASHRYGTLYIGVTNDLARRIDEHRTGKGSEFAKKYKVFRLVDVAIFDRPYDAISREKQLKKWNRDWKISLIETDNLDWRDISDMIV